MTKTQWKSPPLKFADAAAVWFEATRMMTKPTNIVVPGHVDPDTLCRLVGAANASRIKPWKDSDSAYGVSWDYMASADLYTADGGRTWGVEIVGVHEICEHAASEALASLKQR